MKKILLSALMAMAMFSAQAEDVENEVAEAAKTSFSGVYFGGGFHFMNMQDYAEFIGSYHADMENSTKGRIGGTVLLGIGKKFESIPFYLALEASLDFAPNIELYGKDKTDRDALKYMQTTNTGLAYSENFEAPTAPWSQANAETIYNEGLVIGDFPATCTIPQGTAEGAALPVQYYSEANLQETYSIKIRRNGMNPGIGLRIAWASDFLKSLAYIKLGAYFTKDKFRYTTHQYMQLNGVLHTLNHAVTAADAAAAAAADAERPWAAADNVVSRIDAGIAGLASTDRIIESKVGSTEIFNSKVSPELTVGIEKRVGNIGMRLEGGYIWSTAAKFDETGSIKFKKKGSCVMRVLGVWNLNLFK